MKRVCRPAFTWIVRPVSPGARWPACGRFFEKRSNAPENCASRHPRWPRPVEARCFSEQTPRPPNKLRLALSGRGRTLGTVFDAIVLWLHLLGAVVFVGPQVFLAAVAMPAVRNIGDAKLRQDLTRQITRGFGMLGGGALALVILTGFYNFAQVQGDGLMDFKRYFWVLNIKMTLAIVVVLLTAAHGFVFGRRLQELQERDAPEAEIAQARQYSMMASIATLALSVVILLLAALLASNWSFQGGLR